MSTDLAAFLKPQHILHGISASNKKEALLQLAQFAAAHTGLHERTILDTIWERESLCATGLGHGMAAPHAKVAGLLEVTAFVACLDAPIDYNSADNRPVDVIALLLAPIDAGADHLRALATLSKTLRDPFVAASLRLAANEAEAYSALTQAEGGEDAFVTTPLRRAAE